MNNQDTTELCEHSDAGAGCNGRRDFLARAGVVAGGLVLALSSSGCAQAQNAQAQEKPGGPGGPGGGQGGAEAQAPAAGAAATDELVLKLDEASPLSKVGGSQTLDTAEGKVIVARTGEASFAACSAICPHKGGPIKYDAASGELFCPWHGSRFDKSGKVLRPPARQPLQSYASQSAVAVSLKK